MQDQNLISIRANSLAERIGQLLNSARQKVATAVNTAMVYTYFEIGRYIVEDEQGGKERAEYGRGVLKAVSDQLTAQYGPGWSAENLRQMRKFYTLYSNFQATGLDFSLSWSHYLSLLRVEDPDARNWYASEEQLRREITQQKEIYRL